jgi:tyrosine-protein kinase Etk/Wzc
MPNTHTETEQIHVGSFLDLLLILARQKRLLGILPAAIALLATVVVFLTPRWYTATVKIMPPQQSQSNAVAILGQLGALSGMAAPALGLKNPSDIYIAMLKSRTVADALITRFELKRVYDEDLLVEARKELAGNTSITVGREGVITIEVEDTDPKRSADLANAYVGELHELTVNLAVSEAGQRRLFFEGQLKKAKDDLTKAELAMTVYTQQSGLVNPQGQIGVTVAAAASLRAQITAREIQLAAMRSFATESNPDIKRIQQELSGLRSELGKMEKDTNISRGDVLVPMGKASETSIEYVRRYRDMKYFETLFEVLAKQYEIARIDEAKDATLIQVLDKALPAEKKSKPKRALIVVLSAMLGFLAATVIAVARHSLRIAMGDPTRRSRLIALRDLLKA